MTTPTHNLDDHDWIGAEYYSATEAAALLRISARTLHRWAQDDLTLPTVRIHGTVLFPAAALRAWLATQQTIEHERRIQKKGVRRGRTPSA